MDTHQLIRASAEVVTITSFKPGDVYKRVESDYSGGVTLRFGVVQDVMNNGTDAAFTALEYRIDYAAGVVADLKVYDGTKPAALYAAQPEEVRNHLEDLEDSARAKVKAATAELEKAELAHARVGILREQVNASNLTAPAVAAGVIDA